MSGSGTGTKASGAASGGGLIVAPAFEPITLGELKLHLRHDSGFFADNIDETQSIAPGSHAKTTETAYNITGAWVEVLGYSAVVVANYGVLTIGGVVDIKIQESDDKTTITDVTAGAFTQVTISATASTQEKAYTGVKRYIRTAAKVITQASEFGTVIIRLAATSAEDDLLTDIIISAREHVEDICRRQIITATWDYVLQDWPDRNYIKLPYGNLQSVSSIKYKESDWLTSANDITLTGGADEDYIVETNGEQCGRIILPYSGSWPSGALYPSNPITIRYVCGWTTAALVPYCIKAAIKMLCSKLYESRGEDVLGQTVSEDKTVMRLLASARLWDEFL